MSIRYRFSRIQTFDL